MTSNEVSTPRSKGERLWAGGILLAYHVGLVDSGQCLVNYSVPCPVRKPVVTYRVGVHRLLIYGSGPVPHTLPSDLWMWGLACLLAFIRS